MNLNKKQNIAFPGELVDNNQTQQLDGRHSITQLNKSEYFSGIKDNTGPLTKQTNDQDGNQLIKKASDAENGITVDQAKDDNINNQEENEDELRRKLRLRIGVGVCMLILIIVLIVFGVILAQSSGGEKD